MLHINIESFFAFHSANKMSSVDLEKQNSHLELLEYVFIDIVTLVIQIYIIIGVGGTLYNSLI